MRRYEAREARFSNRTLLRYAAASLPETLSVIAAVGDAPVEILLYDEIGFWGVTAKDFALALAQCGGSPIRLRINSPGGDVFDGMAIYNALKAYPAPVECVVDGLAASAASFIALAGNKVTMAEASMLMVHDAWGLVVGNRNDMIETAGVLEKIDGQLAAIYAAKTGKPVADMAAMMDAETWFTANEARQAGLCDAVDPKLSAPPTAQIRGLDRSGVRALARIIPERAEGGAMRAQLPAYDPDGDGDNDAEEALGYLNSIAALIGDAIDCLTGAEDDGGDGAGSGETDAEGMPIVPGATATEEIAAALETERAAPADADPAKEALALRQRRLRLAEAA